MLEQRRKQVAVGRPMPQVNEEYGYEDHYPHGWGGARVAPARSTDNRRRLVWEMVMAGGYQTTGECAGKGLGGWITGYGGDDALLTGNARLMEFITSFDWWQAEPRPDLAGEGTLCLVAPGSLLALYTPAGGKLSVTAPAGAYRLTWFNPRSGAWSQPHEISHPGGMLILPSPIGDDPGPSDGDMAVKIVALGG
jgi:hypothetical protein